MKRILLSAFACLFVMQAAAQDVTTYTLSGRVVDAADSTAFPGVHVVLTSRADTTRQFGALTGANGGFTLRAPEGSYRLRFSFVGHLPHEREITLSRDTNLGVIALRPDVIALEQIIVEERQERVVVRGDTTEYNADAYQVRRDATAEELLSKMPGITTEGGRVQAQGEDVRRVTVDGEEFFGDDAVLALRNLPAEIIDRIQVFDRLSDQAQFTGFDDGSGERSINVVTRGGLRSAQFGRVQGGVGPDGRYLAGGNMSYFDGSRRLSVIGLSNNINQQNFAMEDLMGVVSDGRGGRGGPGGGMMRGGGAPGGGRPGGWGGGGGGFSADPRGFMVGQQAGINTTHALGLNYTDRFGEKLRMNGSYFFNTMGNVNDAALGREYFLSGGESQFYDETTRSTSDNFNHRFNGRIQYDISPTRALIVTPRMSWQQNSRENDVFGFTRLNTGENVNRTENASLADNRAINASTNILYRHRFATPGRTFSANVNLGMNDRSGLTDLEARNRFYNPEGPDDIEAYLQRVDDITGGYTVATNLTWTESLGERRQLQLSYRPTYNRNVSDRDALRFDEGSGQFAPAPGLSMQFDNTVLRHRAGTSFLTRGEKYNLTVGADFQAENLAGHQTLPTEYRVAETFYHVLPTARLQYRFTPTRSLMMIYRASTNTPSISQLRDVIDNTDPLFLTGGNPDLEPSYTNMLMGRFNATNPREGRVLMGFLMASRSGNPIGNASFIARADTVLRDGVTLQRGGQFVQPVNMEQPGWNVRSFFTYGRPFDPLRSNLNLNLGASYSQTPGMINQQLNVSDIYNLNTGFVLGSNISPRLDFTLSTSLNYNVVSNSINTVQDGDYLFYSGQGRLNWLPMERLTLESALTYSQYNGLGGELDRGQVQWNAGVGYRFLTDNAAEVKLSVVDILNQNQNITRTVNEMFIEDRETQMLGRYVMLNVSYRLRNWQR
jgi:hypothetical protein